MAWIQDYASVEAASEQAEKAWRAPLGAVSPLWAMFGAAAGAGVAFWWLTQWSRAAVNFEALAGLAPVDKPPSVRIEIPAEPEPAFEPEPEPEPEAAAVAESPAMAAAPEPRPAPEPAAETVAITAAPVADDLTRMTGIGPKLSAALAARGVTTFAQIAGWTAEDLATIDEALSLKGRAAREAWVAQAKRLARDA